MNPRTTWRWLLSAALLLAFILIHHRYLRRPDPGPQKILPALRPALVNSIEILRPANKIEIAVERSGSQWCLTRPISYAAHSMDIEGLLNGLSNLLPSTSLGAEELKNRPGADEEFGFANPQASIVLHQGTEKIQVLVGGMTGPGDQFYLQVVGVDGVHIVNADILKLLPRGANDWRDTALVDLKSVAIDHVAVSNGGKIYVELQRPGTNGNWQLIRPLPLRADNARIDQSLQSLQTLRVSQFVSDDPKADLEALGLARPELELALSSGSNVVALLQFGKTNNEGSLYARRYGQHTIVTVPTELIAPWRAPVNDFRNQHLVAAIGKVELIEVHGEETFTLARPTNDAWRVMPKNFQADGTLVKDLLSVLSGMHIEFFQDVVTESGLLDYGLAPPRRRYVLQSKALPTGDTNAVLADLHFGAQKDERVLVRRSDENSVYAISTNDFDRLPASSWQFRERRLWNFSEDELSGATIRRDGKKTQILRKEIYKWTFAAGSQGLIKNELALGETIKGLVQVSSIGWIARGEANRGRYGFKEGNLEVTLDLKNGSRTTIEFGGEASPTSQYAASNLDGELLIFEFPWLLFRDLMTYLPVF